MPIFGAARLGGRRCERPAPIERRASPRPLNPIQLQLQRQRQLQVTALCIVHIRVEADAEAECTAR